MKRLIAGSMVLSGLMAAVLISNVQAQGNKSFTGTVERVWEDGFRLNTGDRTFRVDSWDVYGDATEQYVFTGDRVTITGEFERGEFDAFSINNDRPSTTGATTGSDRAPMPVAAQAGTAYSGTVERVWEDGFRLNTGDRTFAVDSWDLCGDFTASYVSVGDRLTITGEFERGEFDLFSMVDTDGNTVCRR